MITVSPAGNNTIIISAQVPFNVIQRAGIDTFIRIGMVQDSDQISGQGINSNDRFFGQTHKVNLISIVSSVMKPIFQFFSFFIDLFATSIFI